MMKEREEDRKDFISNLFVLNLKYVNNYSEFIADSLSLSWSNFINNKKDSLNKLYKNIDKLTKIEEKRKIESLDKVILVDNLLLINKYIKDKKSRFFKTVMYEIQQLSSFSNLLRYYVGLYNQSISKNDKKDELQAIVGTIKKKKNEEVVIEEKKEIVYSADSRGSYYTHIVFNGNKMLFDVDSFNEEKKLYDEYLIQGKKEFLDKRYKFSSFEKKRIIYVNRMFELDACLYSLLNKSIDITYPLEKVFKCAKDLIEVLYKELVEVPLKESVLHNLMVKTIESYGSKGKIKLYGDLVNKLSTELQGVDKFVYDEFVGSSLELIKGFEFAEFRNILGVVPKVDDLYLVVNKNIKQYVVKNVSSILNDFSYLDCFTMYMDVLDIVEVYELLKQEFVELRVSTSKYVLLQKKVVSLISCRFGIDEDDVYTLYLNECRMK